MSVLSSVEVAFYLAYWQPPAANGKRPLYSSRGLRLWSILPPDLSGDSPKEVLLGEWSLDSERLVTQQAIPNSDAEEGESMRRRQYGEQLLRRLIVLRCAKTVPGCNSVKAANLSIG